MTVSREKLHEEVWAEPMTAVAKRYEVSSNYLARICERLGVPVPTFGDVERPLEPPPVRRTLAESLDGVESLVAHPASMTHASMTPQARKRASITNSVVRLSIGIEDAEDLIPDLT